MIETDVSTLKPDLMTLSPVLIIEDEPAIMIRLRRILTQCDISLEDIFLASNITEARILSERIQFNFALVDIGLPDGCGLDLIEELNLKNPQLSTLVISAWGTEDLIFKAFQAGAVGYLLKERDDIEIIQSLRSFRRGGSPIDPFIAKHILNFLAQSQASASHLQVRQQAVPIATSDYTDLLSRRELEILTCVAQGKTNQEIATEIFLAKQTIECHIKNIYRKLAVNCRTKAVYQARMYGLLP